VIRLWDTTTGKQILAPDGATDTVTCVAYSPDGKKVVAGVDGGTVFVWEAATGKEIHVRHLQAGYSHYAGFGAVGFTPEGQVLASANNWPTSTGDSKSA